MKERTVRLSGFPSKFSENLSSSTHLWYVRNTEKKYEMAYVLVVSS